MQTTTHAFPCAVYMYLVYYSQAVCIQLEHRLMTIDHHTQSPISDCDITLLVLDRLRGPQLASHHHDDSYLLVQLYDHT